MGNNFMTIILEQDFYNHAKGFPLENPVFAGFSFGCNLNEYDSFGIVSNSYPMYVRIFPLRGGCQDGNCIFAEGRYANLDSDIRDRECPKVAWGISAYIFDCLNIIASGEIHNKHLTNYVISQDADVDFVIDEESAKNHYHKSLWDYYKQTHSGIKYRTMSEKGKRIAFLKQHIYDEKLFWKRTEPILRNYLCSRENQKVGKLLFDSIESITKQYYKEINKQRNIIQYRWFYQTIGFIKKHIIIIASSFCAVFLGYIYKNFAIALYHYICRLIERF